MLTKTLRFDDDVASVIRNMAWSDNGLTGDITWQLDPGTYKKVKKAIEAVGGSWDKRAKVHRFPKDPRPEFLGVVEDGTLKVARDGFFRTPASVTRYIMARLALGIADYIWLEPEAGDGAIVKVLLEEGQLPERIYCIEQNKDRCAELKKLGVRVANGDFMRYRNSLGIPFNRILMNPPFENGQDMDHIRRAYSLLANGGMMGAILGEGAFFRDDRRSVHFRAWLKLADAYVEKLPERSFHESGTDVATRFITIRKM